MDNASTTVLTVPLFGDFSSPPPISASVINAGPRATTLELDCLSSVSGSLNACGGVSKPTLTLAPDYAIFFATYTPDHTGFPYGIYTSSVSCPIDSSTISACSVSGRPEPTTIYAATTSVRGDGDGYTWAPVTVTAGADMLATTTAAAASACTPTAPTSPSAGGVSLVFHTSSARPSSNKAAPRHWWL